MTEPAAGPAEPGPLPIVVPRNRWDLVPVRARHGRSVSVICPYFEQPESLARLYVALGGQAIDGLEILVVDDGSAHPPPDPPDVVADRVRMLGQPDRGCRPGAARNLGAAASTGDVLVFLDPDTLPGPGCIERLAAWPASIADALVVGRRHHTDLSDWTPADVAAWFGGRRPGPVAGADPAWLDDGYRHSADLLHADARSYRYVISAILACDRVLFDDVGGFDPLRNSYGGEDWEFAARAFHHGAVLAHDPHAVAWHDEPDWADREDSDREAKTAETAWLATTIPHPYARGRGLRHRATEIVADVALEPTATLGQWLVTIDSVLADCPDTTVVLPTDAPAALRHHTGDDARVVTDAADRDDALVRARAVVTLHQPLDVRHVLRRLVDHVLDGDLASIVVNDSARRAVVAVDSSRSIGRGRRARTRHPGATATAAAAAAAASFPAGDAITLAESGARPVPPDVDIAALWDR